MQALQKYELLGEYCGVVKTGKAVEVESLECPIGFGGLKADKLKDFSHSHDKHVTGARARSQLCNTYGTRPCTPLKSDARPFKLLWQLRCFHSLHSNAVGPTGLDTTRRPVCNCLHASTRAWKSNGSQIW